VIDALAEAGDELAEAAIEGLVGEDVEQLTDGVGHSQVEALEEAAAGDAEEAEAAVVAEVVEEAAEVGHGRCDELSLDANALRGVLKLGDLLGEPGRGAVGHAVFDAGDRAAEDAGRKVGQDTGGLAGLIEATGLELKDENAGGIYVDDPVFGDAEGGVEGFLLIKVAGEGGVGDFSDEIGEAVVIEVDAALVARAPLGDVFLAEVEDEVRGSGLVAGFFEEAAAKGFEASAFGGEPEEEEDGEEVADAGVVWSFGAHLD